MDKEQLASILAELTIGDRNAAVKAGFKDDKEGMTFFMLHRRAVALGMHQGDLDSFLDVVKITDLRDAQTKAGFDTAPLAAAPKGNDSAPSANSTDTPPTT